MVAGPFGPFIVAATYPGLYREVLGLPLAMEARFVSRQPILVSMWFISSACRNPIKDYEAVTCPSPVFTAHTAFGEQGVILANTMLSRARRCRNDSRACPQS